MDYVAITLSIPQLHKTMDLLLPLDVPQYVLIDKLMEELDTHTLVSENEGFLTTMDPGNPSKTRVALPIQATLRDVGIMFGQYLVLDYKKTGAKYTLICLQGGQFNIMKDDVILGCHPRLEIDLSNLKNQELVSGKHARIFRRTDGYYLVDLGSTNGTKLNKKPIEQYEKKLNDGDEIILGKSEKQGVTLIFKLKDKSTNGDKLK